MFIDSMSTYWWGGGFVWVLFFTFLLFSIYFVLLMVGSENSFAPGSRSAGLLLVLFCAAHEIGSRGVPKQSSYFFPASLQSK